MIAIASAETVAIRAMLVIDSVAAGILHPAVVREHLQEGWLFGAFFVVVATIQILSVIPIILRDSGMTYPALAIVNGSVIAIWIVSRTIGIPFGPHASMPEPVGAIDLAATAFETLVLAGSLVVARRRMMRGSFRSAHTTRSALA